MQLHKVKVTVNIDKVNISIRFPGQLALQLKNTDSSQDFPKLYSIKNGECLIQENADIQIKAKYSVQDNIYMDQQVSLFLSIITASGKIAAGMVSFDAFYKGQTTLSLKRCSDKSATITLKASYQKLQKIKDIDEQPPQGKQSPIDSFMQSQQSKEKKARFPPSLTLKNSAIDRFNSKSSEYKKRSVPKQSMVENRLKNLEQSNIRKIHMINQDKQEIESELDKVKEKLKLVERKENEAQSALKEHRDTSEKRRIKISELQIKLQDLQIAHAESEKKGRVLQSELKEATQKYKDLQARYALVERKQSGREQTSLDREKKLMQKQQQTEREHQKILNQHNLLLEKMENQQRNNLLNLKNKEKAFIDEKTKWKAELAAANADLSKLKQQMEELNKVHSSLQTQQKNNRKTVTEQYSEIETHKNTIELMKMQLEKAETVRKDLEKELKDLKQLQGDKAALKRKLNEAAQQKLKVIQKLDKAGIQIDDLKQKLKEKELSNDQLHAQSRHLNLRITGLQKEKQSADKTIAKLQSQINSISSKYTFLNQRYNDLHTKSEQSQGGLLEKQQQLVSKISSLVQSKQYVQNDYEDLKWKYYQQQNNISSLEQQLKEKVNDLLALQQSYLKVQKATDNFQVQLQQQKQLGVKMAAQKDELDSRLRQTNDQLKKKEIQLYRAQKDVNDLRQDNYMLTEKMVSQLKQKADQTQKLQTAKRTLQNDLNQNRKKARDLQTLLNQENQSKLVLEKDLGRLKMELEENSKRLKELQNSNIQLARKNQQYKKQMGQYQQKINQNELYSNNREQSLNQEMSDVVKKLTNAQNDLRLMKKAAGRFMEVILNEQQQVKSEIEAFPDELLANQQLQTIKRRNQQIVNHKAKLSQLNEEILFLQKEVNNKNKDILYRAQQTQKFIKEKNLKQRQAELQWDLQKDQLKNQLTQVREELDGVKSQKQRLQTKHKGLSDLYQQQKKALQLLIAQSIASKEEIRKLESNILDIRSKEINKKGQEDTILHNLKVELKEQIQAEREKYAAKEVQNKLLEKRLGDKEKTISQLKLANIQIQQQKAQKQKKLGESQDKLTALGQEKAKLQAKTQQLSKNITDLNRQVEVSNQQVKSLKGVNEQLANKLKDLHGSISEQMIAQEKLNNKLQLMESHTTSSKQQQKHKIIQLEQSLQEMLERSNKLFKEVTELSSTVEMKDFLIKQLQDKVTLVQSTNFDLKKDVQDKRHAIIDLNHQLQQGQRSLIALQLEKTDSSHNHDSTNRQLMQKKERINTLEQQLLKLSKLQAQTAAELKVTAHNQNKLKEQTLILGKVMAELRDTLAESKKEGQKGSLRESQMHTKLSLLQQQLKEKEESNINYKAKNSQQTKKQANLLHDRCKHLESQLRQAHRELQEVKQQSENKLQMLQAQAAQLEALLTDREYTIQGLQEELAVAQQRILGLNSQLRTCFESWEKQKVAAQPSRKQMMKMQGQMAKFLSYSQQLDRNTNLLLSHTSVKAKDQQIAKSNKLISQLIEMSKPASEGWREDIRYENIGDKSMGY